ncbi:hypothetical protein L9G15_26820, partial [Shewanella sp. A3A]|nr:hypothetical protein [Shewanella ferrihydritica]
MKNSNTTHAEEDKLLHTQIDDTAAGDVRRGRRRRRRRCDEVDQPKRWCFFSPVDSSALLWSFFFS